MRSMAMAIDILLERQQVPAMGVLMVQVNQAVQINVSADEAGNIIEVQATAEGKSYSLAQLTEMTQMAIDGIKQLNEVQTEALASIGVSMGSILQRPEDIPS